MSDVERVAKIVHEALSRAHVTAYLDMPDDTAEIIAAAAMREVRLIDAEALQKMASAMLLRSGCTDEEADEAAGIERAADFLQQRAKEVQP